MAPGPLIVTPDARLQDALGLLEDHASQISALPVVDAASDRFLGLVRLLDIYQAWFAWGGAGKHEDTIAHPGRVLDAG